MKVGDIVVIKPNRLDDYKILSSVGLLDVVGVVTRVIEGNNLCEIFVQNRYLIIPKVYLLETNKDESSFEPCESCECDPCDCDWGH